MALVMKIYHLFNNPHITGYLDSIFLLCYYEGNKYCNVCFFMHIDSSRVLTVFLGENSTKEVSGQKFVNLFLMIFDVKGPICFQVSLTSLEIKGGFIRCKGSCM